MKHMTALLCALLVQPAAHADILPGHQITDWAASYVRNGSGQGELVDAVGATALIAYVTGIAEALKASGKICMPEHTSAGQLVEVVEQYIQANGDKWNDSGFELVSAPLRQTFKCVKKRR